VLYKNGDCASCPNPFRYGDKYEVGENVERKRTFRGGCLLGLQCQPATLERALLAKKKLGWGRRKGGDGMTVLTHPFSGGGRGGNRACKRLDSQAGGIKLPTLREQGQEDPMISTSLNHVVAREKPTGSEGKTLPKKENSTRWKTKGPRGRRWGKPISGVSDIKTYRGNPVPECTNP